MRTPSKAVTVPRVMGKWELTSDRCKADKNGMRAAATISTPLIPLVPLLALGAFGVVPVDLVFEAGNDRIAFIVSDGRGAHGCPL